MINFSIIHYYSLDMTNLENKNIPFLALESCPKSRQQFNNIIIADARECSINSNESHDIQLTEDLTLGRFATLHREGVISVYAPRSCGQTAVASTV